MKQSYGWTADTVQELSPDDRVAVIDVFNASTLSSLNVTEEEMVYDRPDDLCVGRMVIQLFADVPRASANFAALCTGEKGIGKQSGKPLHYKGCSIHRIEPGKLLQTGDFVKGNGSAGESIYGGSFKDESTGLKHKNDCRGVVGMANSGKHSNTSQFYITFAPLPTLDGVHVVFGKVVQGMSVLDAIEVCVSKGLQNQVRIGNCGLL
jgi:cyclophilin family peptidyl-prolyl cis-trans isomerase